MAPVNSCHRSWQAENKGNAQSGQALVRNVASSLFSYFRNMGFTKKYPRCKVPTTSKFRCLRISLPPFFKPFRPTLTSTLPTIRQFCEASAALFVGSSLGHLPPPLLWICPGRSARTHWVYRAAAGLSRANLRSQDRRTAKGTAVDAALAALAALSAL